MAYNFDKVLTVGNWEVKVDTKAMYGCFEHQCTGTGGGLWMEKAEGSDELNLHDYDGVFALPSDVVCALTDMNICVGEDFESGDYDDSDEPPTSVIIGYSQRGE